MPPDEGSAGAGNPGAPGAGDGGSGGAGAGEGAPATAWTDRLPDDLKPIALNKGWDSEAAAVKSYAELERLLGADKAGRGIIIPNEATPPEEKAAFWGRLGRPDTPDGYKLPVPEGDPGEFAKTASGWFHEGNLTTDQALFVTGKWNEYQVAMDAQFKTEAAQDKESGETALHKAWGAQYDTQVELGRRAMREMGFTEDHIAAFASVAGYETVMRGFAKGGVGFSEAKVHGFDSDARSAGKMTPEMAEAQMAAYQADPAYAAALKAGNAQKLAEWKMLQDIAYNRPDPA
jgi:hypothetical protein